MDANSNESTYNKDDVTRVATAIIGGSIIEDDRGMNARWICSHCRACNCIDYPAITEGWNINEETGRKVEADQINEIKHAPTCPLLAARRILFGSETI